MLQWGIPHMDWMEQGWCEPTGTEVSQCLDSLLLQKGDCCQDTWIQHIMSTHSYHGHAWLCDLIQHPKMVMGHPKSSFCEVSSAPSLVKALCPARVTGHKVCAGFCRDRPRGSCDQEDWERRLQYVQTIHQTSGKNQHCHPIFPNKKENKNLA